MRPCWQERKWKRTLCMCLCVKASAWHAILQAAPRQDPSASPNRGTGRSNSGTNTSPLHLSTLLISLFFSSAFIQLSLSSAHLIHPLLFIFTLQSHFHPPPLTYPALLRSLSLQTDEPEEIYETEIYFCLIKRTSCILFFALNPFLYPSVSPTLSPKQVGGLTQYIYWFISQIRQVVVGVLQTHYSYIIPAGLNCLHCIFWPPEHKLKVKGRDKLSEKRFVAKAH